MKKYLFATVLVSSLMQASIIDTVKGFYESKKPYVDKAQQLYKDNEQDIKKYAGQAQQLYKENEPAIKQGIGKLTGRPMQAQEVQPVNGMMPQQSPETQSKSPFDYARSFFSK